MFTAANFTVAKIYKQPKYPSTGEWLKMMWYLYIMEYYSATKKPKSCHLQQHEMDLESTILCKISQTEKDRYCVISLICGI